MTSALGALGSPLGENATLRAFAARRCYRVFGAVLDSEIEFPELVPIEGGEDARWTMRVRDDAPPPMGDTPLGSRQLGPEFYSLSRTTSGLRLQYSHAGVFDLSADGSEIVWYRQDGAIHELVRSIVLGPVLALSLELSGLLCLHGSAVAIDGAAIVFLGPKHYGKSTLATALTASGARLVGDDLIAVAPGPPATVRPGVPSVRLWEDSAGALAVNEICGSVVRGVKTTASGFAERAVTDGQLPLAAIYLLEPVEAREGFACERTRLPGGAAAIGLAHQTKLADSLIGTAAAGSQLIAAARLASTVPVWNLATARELQRLPQVVARIMDWHQGPR